MRGGFYKKCIGCGFETVLNENLVQCGICGGRFIILPRCPECGAEIRQDNDYCECGRYIGEVNYWLKSQRREMS